MQLIAHRKNTITELKATDTKYGIEVDIRSFRDKLITHHDPFIEGEDFTKWIEHYNHKTLILNVKEEGLEKRLLEIMKEKQIEDFFFLDQSFPFLIKTSNAGEKRCAVRVSEFENIETAFNLAGKVEWAWVDCFSKMPLTTEDYKTLKNAGFKLCLVSPELQGRVEKKYILEMKNLLSQRNITFDATCTKTPELWEKL